MMAGQGHLTPNHEDGEMDFMTVLLHQALKQNEGLSPRIRVDDLFGSK